MKKNNKKGFTLAELLIVVAIIGVLTAIAIPVFTTQLEKSREAADEANARSAYAQAAAAYLTDQTTESVTLQNITFAVTASDSGVSVTGTGGGLQSTKYKDGITFSGTSGFSAGS